MDQIERLRFLASLPRAGAGREKTQPFNWIPSHRVTKGSAQPDGTACMYTAGQKKLCARQVNPAPSAPWREINLSHSFFGQLGTCSRSSIRLHFGQFHLNFSCSESSDWEAKFYQIQSKYLLLLNELHNPQVSESDSRKEMVGQLLKDVVEAADRPQLNYNNAQFDRYV